MFTCVYPWFNYPADSRAPRLLPPAPIAPLRFPLGFRIRPISGLLLLRRFASWLFLPLRLSLGPVAREVLPLELRTRPLK